MHIFTTGNRRIAGLFSLTVALVCLCGWIRSRSLCEILCLPSGERSQMCVISADEMIVCVNSTPALRCGWWFKLWQTDIDRTSEVYGLFAARDIVWMFRFGEFGIGQVSEQPFTHGRVYSIVSVPYWLVVLLWTLPSLWYLIPALRVGKGAKGTLHNCRFD